MRADSADRIYLEPAPAALAPPISIARIFAIGLVLPFAHVNRLVLAGLAPGVLIGGLCLTPFGGSILDWLNFIIAMETQGPAPESLASAWTAAWTLLGLFLATALWLCAWQRSAATGGTEPLGRWLLRSFLRLPGYAGALLFWLLAPFVITLPGTFLIGWALERSRIKAKYDMPTGIGISADMLTPVQWWVAGIGTLTFAILGLWLSARLLPLPALVASRGWRKSPGKAWQLSAGHGFGLSVSLIGYSLIGLILWLVAYAILFLATVPIGLGADDDPRSILTFIRMASVASLATAALMLFWHTGIAALLVRESASLDDPLDPATFD